MMKRYREHTHLSVSQLAELAHVDETNILRAETGKAVPRVKADAIAAALSKAARLELSSEALDIKVES